MKKRPFHFFLLLALLLAGVLPARAWYDPSTCSWMSKDPKREGGDFPNPYWAFRNQPFNFIDPDGGQAIPNNLGFGSGMVDRSRKFQGMQDWGASPQQAQSLMDAGQSFNTTNEDLAKAYIVYLSAGASAVMLPAGAGVSGILQETVLGTGIAGFNQLSFNLIDRRDLLDQVPQAAFTGGILSGGAGALVRGFAPASRFFGPRLTPSNYDWASFWTPYRGGYAYSGLPFPGMPRFLPSAAKSEATVYRVFGGDARAQGFSWTTVDPRTVSNFRNGAGLPSGGASGATNTADFLLQGKVNPADIIKSRSALPLDGNAGGLPELIIDSKNVRLNDFSVLNP